MSNPFRAAVILFATVLLMPAGPAVARAAAPAASATPVPSSHARLGSRGFSRRTPSFGSRYRTRTRSPFSRGYRRSPFRGFFGGVLKALGVAYLFHMLFGWGGGGSPFGLLLLVAIVLWFATRRRRRREARAPAWR